MEKHPVIIVGAGPAGLMTAVLLERMGIDFLIIDKKKEITMTSNALGVQARTLELWNTIGLASRAIEQGNRVNQAKIYAEDKVLLELNFAELPSVYPFLLVLPQHDTEALLLNELSAKGKKVLFGHELVEFKQEQEEISLTIQSEQNTFTIKTDWLLACDGYHSSIRPKMEVQYVGEDLAQHFIMMDTLVDDGDLPKDQSSIFFHPDGAMIFIPMKNQYRVIAEIGHDPAFHGIKNFDLSTFTEITNRRLKNKTIHYHSPTWQSSFYVHERLATPYQHDHIFLIGDAAHAHSPAGGQGMNTGIQDAFNLAWKLALVIQGKADEALLRTYQKERQPIAKAVIERSTHLTQVASLQHSWLIKLRDKILPFMSYKLQLNKKMADFMSEIAVCYPNEQNPLIGQRAADFDPQYQFMLVIFNETEETKAAKDWLNEKLNGKITIQHHKAGSSVQPYDYWLIRPDQYIGFTGNSLKELISYFGSELRLLSQH